MKIFLLNSICLLSLVACGHTEGAPTTTANAVQKPTRQFDIEHNDPLAPTATSNVPDRTGITTQGWRSNWSTYLEDRINTYDIMSDIPADIARVCPRFKSLSATDKKDVIVYFIHTIAVAESNLHIAGRYIETTMGIDPITGRQVRSEGLFQLSYQDHISNSCAFSWNADKSLPEDSEIRTILNPFIQLDCASRIFKRQIATVHSIFPSNTFYWSVLKTGRRGYRVISSLMAKNVSCGL